MIDFILKQNDESNAERAPTIQVPVSGAGKCHTTLDISMRNDESNTLHCDRDVDASNVSQL